MVLSLAILFISQRPSGTGEPAPWGGNTKKRPENGSGRKVDGQIRGGSIDVNAGRRLAVVPNSATFKAISSHSISAISSE